MQALSVKGEVSIGGFDAGASRGDWRVHANQWMTDVLHMGHVQDSCEEDYTGII